MIDNNKAKGEHLTRLGEMLGLRRKWFGLEPDFMFRRRINNRKGVTFF